jgi:alpha-D-ribose 1-methylphosphonate 5-triphosphate synthase subunit PhnH
MAVDLSLVCKGFDDPVKDSQRSFRTILNALSQPGTVGQLDAMSLNQAPSTWTEAMWAVAMTLLDGDTRVWLSPSLATPVALASLQFHTSCPISQKPGEADFVFVGHPIEQPDWSSLRQGEAEFPDLSATVVLQVPGIEVVEPRNPSGEESTAPNFAASVAPIVTPNIAPFSTWELRGPGIAQTQLLRLQHDPEDPWPEKLRHAMVANRDRFPLGVDLLLVWRDLVCALPRSTRVAAI